MRASSIIETISCDGARRRLRTVGNSTSAESTPTVCPLERKLQTFFESQRSNCSTHDLTRAIDTSEAVDIHRKNFSEYVH